MKTAHSGPAKPRSAIQEAVELADRLCPNEGSNVSMSEDVTLLRASKSIPRVPVLYLPSIVFVLQGRKRGFVGSQDFVYDAKTLLVLSAPVPFECVTETADDKPLLAVYVRLRREVIADILAAMDEMAPLPKSGLRAIEATKLTADLADAVTRLLKALCTPGRARVLGTQLVREIIYHVLVGEKGDGVRAMVNSGGHFSQICRILQYIHHHYDQELEVEDLARDAGMSASIFHLRFKEVASTSPIQYIKAVRLHRARALLLMSDITAAGAALSVGYKSPSHFARDFKRFFGLSPSEEVEKVLQRDGAHVRRVPTPKSPAEHLAFQPTVATGNH